MGHDYLFQPWETLVDSTDAERPHDGPVVKVGPVGVYAAQVEVPDGMRPAGVRIYVDSHLDDFLTPQQGRELARWLTDLANDVEQVER
jgi:hypothetical protein